MTATKLGRPVWPHAEALAVAYEVQDVLLPACHRSKVAGSLRRCAPQVHDIELLCVPREAEGIRHDMFGKPLPTDDALTDTVHGLLLKGYFQQRGAFGPKNKLLIHATSGIPVDVFSTTAENWGMALVVLTGPATFNISLMAELRRRGMHGHAYGGITLVDGTEQACPTEEFVFAPLGWPYIPPEKRL